MKVGVEVGVRVRVEVGVGYLRFYVKKRFAVSRFVFLFSVSRNYLIWDSAIRTGDGQRQGINPGRRAGCLLRYIR